MKANRKFYAGYTLAGLRMREAEFVHFESPKFENEVVFAIRHKESGDMCSVVMSEVEAIELSIMIMKQLAYKADKKG